MNRLQQLLRTCAAGSRANLFYQWTWELPQNVAGVLMAMIVLPSTIHIASFEQRTVITTQGNWGAISLGNFIIGDRWLTARVGNDICMHEFGHCLQSRPWGWLYLVVIGIPSLYSATFRKNHQRFWTERNANKRAAHYFSSRHGFTAWNHKQYPTQV